MYIFHGCLMYNNEVQFSPNQAAIGIALRDKPRHIRKTDNLSLAYTSNATFCERGEMHTNDYIFNTTGSHLSSLDVDTILRLATRKQELGTRSWFWNWVPHL
ncbi:hypothetical protein CDAR_14381 [Caerostris darwini]|uniref:Uncharacterized protein n=1 Tax=Caerostris darwini TaxID=1538125 RepID=A0AAV4QD30_9ARAC|nr:hypothetical protein CDAR_14381 [Caerostris darwini]